MEREAAAKTIASTLRKEEKALETMNAKNARPWQLDRLAADVAHHKAMLALMEDAPAAPVEIEAALSAIPGCIARIKPYLEKFPVGTAQHTLAVRRIAAYHAAEELGRQKLEEDTCC